LTAELAKTRGLEGARGALINAIEPGSVADDNDIRPDDLIIEINYRPVSNQEDFLHLTRDLKSGDDVAIKVLRKDRRLLRSPVIISFTMP
jgi:S1-C subfamily serine protease